MNIATSARMTRPWTAGTRIACLLATAAPFIVSARTIAVPPAPAPGFADTEASTNVAVRVDDRHVREMRLRFKLQDAGVSNCLQVAFGRDADGDGVLGADETDTLFGWRNGRYFAENTPGGFRAEEAGGGTSRVFTIGFRLSRGRGLRRFTASNETDAAVFTNFSASAQTWLYSPEWNMMRVTRRGSGVPAEWFS